MNKADIVKLPIVLYGTLLPTATTSGMFYDVKGNAYVVSHWNDPRFYIPGPEKPKDKNG